MEERIIYLQNREDKKKQEFYDMERKYAEKIRLLEDKNLVLVEENKEKNNVSTGPKSIAGAEELLSEQLRDMTAVLEDFDIKYTKKEKQLEMAREQNKQLKQAFDKLRLQHQDQSMDF